MAASFRSVTKPCADLFRPIRQDPATFLSLSWMAGKSVGTTSPEPLKVWHITGTCLLHPQRLYNRLDFLAEILVGNANHCRIERVRMGDQQVFCGLGINVHTAGVDHVGAEIR